jgi:hypothetical protein
MASDHRRAIRLAAAMGVGMTVLLLGTPSVHAADAWWSEVGLPGVAVTRVSATGNTIVVRTGTGQTLESSDGGRTFAAAPSGTGLPPTGVVAIGSQRWTIDSAGLVSYTANVSLRSSGAPEANSPHLGAGADLIASPAALPGVVVAVSTSDVVYRRGQDGDWKAALLLLPASLVQGVPRVTSVTAFTQPLSEAIYLSTDGYSVLISTDGGDDWIRAGPGLPDSVYSLSADSARHAVYAGTSSGLWVHVLQELPAPPAYQDAALVWRWLGIGAVTILASVLALLGMVRLAPRRAAG